MNATLVVEYEPEILRIFEQEDKTIGKASYTITHDNKNITFALTAQDATGMRTLFNAITKLLSIWEKSQDL